MTYDENARAFWRTQLEGRLIAAAPRVLFRSPTCSEDLQALVRFVESEIERAMDKAKADRRREGEEVRP